MSDKVKVAIWYGDNSNFEFKVNPTEDDCQDGESIILVEPEVIERWKKVQKEWDTMQDEMAQYDEDAKEYQEHLYELDKEI